MPIPAIDPSTLPDWAPTLQEVADYCTSRTLVPNGAGGNTELAGFSSVTHPSDLQVGRLIADAIGWVQLKTGAVHTTLAGQANMVATVRTAGFVELRVAERQHTNRDDAIATSDRLLKLADQMRTDLDLANQAATGTDPEDPAANVLPVWSFPDPPAYTPY